MPHIAIIGAGIAGVTSAYSLLNRGYEVTLLDRNRYPAMETSFANGGQLSASNAEVWNRWGTIFHGLARMHRSGSPLLFNPSPSWHKYSWIAEFLANIARYRQNTIETARLAIQARNILFEIADREGIEFDLQRRGILHVYSDAESFTHARQVTDLLRIGGLERRAVTNDEIRGIEPALHGTFYGGFFTPSDSTGDIHKFTRGLARACLKRGMSFVSEASVNKLAITKSGVDLCWSYPSRGQCDGMSADAVLICAGVGSREIAALAGDRLNVYPVKGYSITVHLHDSISREGAPWVSLLDDQAKIVTSRLGEDRFRVAGTAEFNGYNYDIRAERITPLVHWTRRLFPRISTDKVAPWAGLRPMLPNMMPRVGAARRPRIFYNTGHGHLGWTLSAATAEIAAASIQASMRTA